MEFTPFKTTTYPQGHLLVFQNNFQQLFVNVYTNFHQSLLEKRFAKRIHIQTVTARTVPKINNTVMGNFQRGIGWSLDREMARNHFSTEKWTRGEPNIPITGVTCKRDPSIQILSWNLSYPEDSRSCSSVEM